MEETTENAPLVMHCPECSKLLDVTGLPPYAKIECPHCASGIRVRSTMGQYQIVGMLGEGGMSQVFRALDRNLGREVALKILHQSLSRDAALTAMFEREAKLTASIVHPNVVKVFSVGQDHGYFFIAMELLQAISLEQLIANKGALSETEVLSIALDVSRGLKAAFEEQLIHRDIKPGNMLVTGDGTAKLVDFGLALQQGGEDLSEDLWATPFYVPPEKLDGYPDTFLGDIYSLGATLYHALAGKPPFDANTSSMEDLKAIKKNAVDLKSAAPGLSKATVKLVEKMMAYRPEERILSYDELIAQIEEVRRRQFGIESIGRVRSKKKRVGLILAVGGTLMAITVAAVFFLLNGHDPLAEGDLGIGGGDRVITAGDNSITGQFVGARELFSEGKFREATDQFTSLVSNEAVPASTRMWCRYFLGMIHLFSGEQELAREAFGYVLDLTPEADASHSEAVAFLKRSSASLSEPLPLLPGEVNYASDTIESLGLLAAGLKNWQHGEWDSGVEWMRAFAESRPPAEYPWIERLKGRIEPFRADHALIASLPNPKATLTEAELTAEAAALTQGRESLGTRGAAPRLVKKRLDRIETLRKLAAAPVLNGEGDGGEAVGSVPPADSVATPAEQVEIEKLKALVASFQSYSETLLFSGAVLKLQGETLETPLGNALKEALILGYGEADLYPARLAEILSANSFTGVIRRRQGNPIEATITSATADTLTIDLGFGPNEVEVVDFAPDWLVEAGTRFLPPVSPESGSSWRTLLFFGLFTGQGTQLEPSAAELVAVDPEFARGWQLIARLR